MKKHAELGFLGFAAVFGIAASLIVAGCGSNPTAPPPAASSSNSSSTSTAAQNIPMDVQSGIAVAVPSPNPQQLTKLADSKDFHSRQDPFALTSAERAFDAQQTALALVSTNGSFPLYYTAPVPKQPPQEQAQPYRRLSGVLVGNSVLAIIDMGDGQPPRIVSPGEIVPGTDWRVISIDDDKAVLRRAGDVLPHTIDVPLEQPPAGSGGSGSNSSGLAGGTGAKGGGPAGAKGKVGGPRMGGVSGQ